METRKLIKFGKDSFVVSLPKSWVRSNKLKKGDPIFLKESKDGKISLSSKSQDDTRKIKKITIDANNSTINTIKRQIIAAYLNHYNIIEIRSKNIGNLAKDIRETLHELVALEIMGENKEKIIARDFLKLDSLSIKNSIKRMDLLIKSMFIDTKELKAKSDLKSISQRDIDINRLFFLGYRATTEILSNQEIMRNFKLTSTKVLGYWKIMMDLERTSDQLKIIARFLFDLDKKEKASILEVLIMVEEQYKQAMKAFNTENLSLAFEALELKAKIVEKCEEHIKKCSKPALRIYENILHTTRVIHHIPRVLVNTEDLFLLLNDKNRKL